MCVGVRYSSFSFYTYFWAYTIQYSQVHHMTGWSIAVDGFRQIEACPISETSEFWSRLSRFNSKSSIVLQVLGNRASNFFSQFFRYVTLFQIIPGLYIILHAVFSS